MGVLIQGALLTFAMDGSRGRSATPEALHARIDDVWSALATVLGLDAAGTAQPA